MTAPETHTLMQHAVAAGERVPCAGNLPLDMNDPQSVWLVEQGAVDVFLVERRDGADQTAPQHLLRAAAGRLLPGIAAQEQDTTLGLVGKGLPGTLLRRLPVTSLDALAADELAGQVDAWLMDLSAMLSRGVTSQPRPDAVIEQTREPVTMAGRLAPRRAVVWLSEPPRGTGLFMELVDPVLNTHDNGAGVLPLTPHSWLTLMEPAQLSTHSSETLAGAGRLLPALAGFHSLVFAVERLNRSLAVIDEANLERERSAGRRSDETDARQRLFNLYGLQQETRAGAQDEALMDALKLIGRHEGIDFKQPPKLNTVDSAIALEDVLQVSSVRWRRVKLAREEKWWAGDSGALLAFREDDNQPVALLPAALGHYWEVEPLSRRRTRVTAKRAASLRAQAWQFYPSLSPAGAGTRDLLHVAKKGLPAALALCLVAGLVAGLIALLPAALLGFVADRVIPNGETGLLYLGATALVGLGLLGALLHVLRGSALMRLEGRVAARLEAVFWDRLLRLPPNFLQRYSAGDVAMRGMAFQRLRDAVQEVLANAILSIVFLAPALLLIFWYDAALGGVCAAFALLSLALTVALGVVQIQPQSKAVQIAQHLGGRLNQLVSGIIKLRVAGAEGSAFAVWARHYRAQKQAEVQHGARDAHLQAFSAALPFLAAAALFLAATLPGREAIPAGEFIAVFLLFILFQTAVVRLGASFGTIATIIPTLNQVRPFLSEPTELSTEGEPVGELKGEILVDHVSFRYDPAGPLILDGVSLHARPGEFIAIAGGSGSGKSTLFKLMLGLNQPAAGSIYYDGRDLRHLNIKQLRRQIGVVPQEIQLHPQDLWDNIVGGHEQANNEDVWEKARLASIDRAIRAMPMKMLTPVGANLISGGEAQRILIAHALIRNPRLLLLDEATNWLDNDSQATIMRNVEKLASTRIVIAHRLSTLRQADRIYMLQDGKVAQQGAFAELAETEGPFRELVRRQLA